MSVLDVRHVLLIKFYTNKETEMSAGLQHALHACEGPLLNLNVSVLTTFTHLKGNPSVPRCALVHAELFTQPRAFVNFSAN